MSAQRKRAAHRCHVHHGTAAVGRCSVCRSWVCGKCAAKLSHRLYCSHCAPRPLSQSATGIADPSAKPTLVLSRLLPIPWSLVVFSTAAVAVCALFFGVWALLRAQGLSEQNKALKEKRVELLGQIKDRNREIADLHSLLDSLAGRTNVSPRNRKGPFVVRSEPVIAESIDGIPISFDNGSVSKRLVSLTFDGNDQANAASEILDTLKSRNVRATMFLSGQFIKRYATVVSRIMADGHEIGSHTFSHPHLTSYAQDHTQTVLPAVSELFLHRELLRTDSLFRTLFGAPLAPLWRAPFGEYNREICLWARHAGFLHVGWRQGKTWRLGLDSNDWTPDEETPGYHSPQQVFDKIVGLAHSGGSGINGGIILMHLNSARLNKEEQVHHVLGRLIDTLQAAGYRFVTVGEMLRESDVDISRLKRNY